MMDGIKEESVGSLFNLQFEVQENPIVEEVGAGAALAFGGNLPGVSTGGASARQPTQAAPAAVAAPARRAAPPIPPEQPAPAAPPAAFGKKPGVTSKPRGRHAADGRGHATAAGRGKAATRSAAQSAEAEPQDEPQDTIPESAPAASQPVLPAGFQPNRPRTLQYSAPSEDGGVERHSDSSDDDLYANVNRNDPCPCGSGRKYKRCHGAAGSR
jgi:preprotein translocase subunit SecA